MPLRKKLCLITGAGSGIGRALCRTFAAQGTDIILVGRRSDALAETAALLPSGQAVAQITADITTAEGRLAVVLAVRRFGALDILVNNAGQVIAGPLGEIEDGALQAMIATNVTAPIALTRDLLPALRASATPRVVNVGSMFGDIAHPMFAAYSATKFATRGFSDALRRELAGQGIAVTYAAPRATRTPAAGAFAHLESAFAMRFDSPEIVARNIVRAIVNGRSTAYASGIERLFVLVQRLFPRLIDNTLSRQAGTAALAHAARGSAKGRSIDTADGDRTIRVQVVQPSQT